MANFVSRKVQTMDEDGSCMEKVVESCVHFDFHDVDVAFGKLL